MAKTGRRLHPVSSLEGPERKVSWTLRAIRSAHQEAEVRITESFAQRLADAGRPLAPETVNKIERATVKLSVDHCVAYEIALGLTRSEIVDVYCYTARIHDVAPRGTWWNEKEFNADLVEVFARMRGGDSVPALDFLRLSALAANRPELFEGIRTREVLCESFFAALAGAHESEERLLLESAINFGDVLLPALTEQISAAPEDFFNLIEVCGHIPTEQSANILQVAWPLAEDDFVAPNLLEAIGRLSSTCARLDDDAAFLNLRREAEAYSRELLLANGVSYMAQEESLDLLYRWRSQSSLTQCMAAKPEDIDQLRLRCPGITNESLYEIVRRSISDAAAGEGDAVSALCADGLTELVVLALTARTRRQRLSIAVLLSPWIGSGVVAKAVGDIMLNRLPVAASGVRRAAVRLLTKIENPAAREPLLGLAARHDLLEEGVRFVLVWALGSFSDRESMDAVTRLYAGASTSATKRAALVAAGRQRNTSLLREMTDDVDPRVSLPATQGLQQHLQETIPRPREGS